MSRKIRQPRSGQSKAVLTQLKELPAAERKSLMDILRSKPYVEAAPIISASVGFECTAKVLLRFFHWEEAEDALALGNDRLRQIVEFLREQLPDMQPEKVRELGTMFLAIIALSQEDGKAFVQASRAGVQSERELLRAKKLNLDERKFQESMRKKLDAGFEALSKVFQKNPGANRLFEQAREMVRDET